MHFFQQLMNIPPREVFNILREKISPQTKISAFSGKNPCVFVLSTGRVGTMTFASLISKYSNVRVFHEPSPYLFSISRANYLYGSNIPQEFWALLWQALREKHLNDALVNGKGYIETSPQCTFLAPIIASFVPNVRFIHLVRNPFDVIRSAISRNWYNGHPADRNRIEPRSGSDYRDRWHDMTVIEKNIWLWFETNRWIIDQLKQMPKIQSIQIKAEEMFNGNIDTLAQIYSFCGIDSFDTKATKKILQLRLNKQQNLAPTTFKSWSVSEKKFAKNVLSDLLIEIGYNDLASSQLSK